MDEEMVEFGNLTGDNFDDFVPCCLVKGVCKNFDAGTPDGCPVGWHNEYCDCYKRRGKNGRGLFKCGIGNNEEETQCCCSNTAAEAMAKDDLGLEKCPNPHSIGSILNPFKRDINKEMSFGAPFVQLSKKHCFIGKGTQGVTYGKKKTIGQKIGSAFSKVKAKIDDVKPIFLWTATPMYNPNTGGYVMVKNLHITSNKALRNKYG